MDESELLDGWKEIASYLGRSVRSAQRWESQLALPVHRIPTPEGGQLVYARRGELDAWRARQDALDNNGHEATPHLHRDPPSASRRWMLAVSVLTLANIAAAAVLLVTWADSYRGPASYEIAGRSVRAGTLARIIHESRCVRHLDGPHEDSSGAVCSRPASGRDACVRRGRAAA
jgi:hypothetical protein